MNSIEKQLMSMEEPFLHLAISSEEDFCQLARGWLFKDEPKAVARIVRGKKSRTLDNLYDEFAAAFQFPCYFGENWPAFGECVNDLEWLPGEGYFVFVSNVNNMLVNDDEDFKILVRILLDAAKDWAKGRHYNDFPTEPTPFHIIVHCLPEKASEVKTRFSRIGVESIDVITLV